MAKLAKHLRKLQEQTDLIRSTRAAREQEICEAWNAGASIREITAATQLSHTSIADILERHGVRAKLTRAELDDLRRGK